MPWVDALEKKRAEEEEGGVSDGGNDGVNGVERGEGPDMRPRRMGDSFYRGVSFDCSSERLRRFADGCVLFLFVL